MVSETAIPVTDVALIIDAVTLSECCMSAFHLSSVHRHADYIHHLPLTVVLCGGLSCQKPEELHQSACSLLHFADHSAYASYLIYTTAVLMVIFFYTAGSNIQNEYCHLHSFDLILCCA